MFFWLGPKGAKTPLHRDLGNVFLVQVWGRKLWGDYAPTAGVPLFASRSEGAYLWDVDGHRYIDCALGYGSVVLGHGHPAVADAMRQAARLGGHSTLLNRWHAELAQRFVDMIPAAEMVAFLRTGSDAVSAAVRLARAITKRRVVLHWGLHG
ncbi:aminotransferase class III-fold pyridoxal phosphate-dependent enzyme [Ralstonia pseudosolanacearum]|uniref:aminotransferase class III-fold pyridoxal phosphate-dependent enzyme n=1 Tax=Ralstonia pseudosolanacearum TaxID=1310165 RepID=UPI001E498232|nr:aminotransferase class III-fold pyridoxal phosphate-dependent enzyme [Ralstonia pseudosolanacearum]MDO3529879.1 aminotransferase class III-fold pyridoxal phosphate-dependent enzyme [Ralstonia pseudosolanacearum]